MDYAKACANSELRLKKELLENKDRQRNEIQRATARRIAWPFRRGKKPGWAPSRALRSMVFPMRSPLAVRSARTPRIGGAPRPVKTMVFIKTSKIDFVCDL